MIIGLSGVKKGYQRVHQYNFNERLNFSFGVDTRTVETILKERISSVFAVQKANTDDDRNGVDYWIHRDHGLPPLAIDLKRRQKDYLKLEEKDDLCLETWSVCFDKIGWTRDPKKRCDFIMWYWEPTSRFCIVSFPILCKVFSYYWRVWRDSGLYRVHKQNTEDKWKSECIIVPRLVVFNKMRDAMNGVFGEKKKKGKVYHIKPRSKKRKIASLPLFDGLI